MGVRLLEDKDSGECVLYCSTTDWAFGPVMPDIETAEAFLKYLANDARAYTDPELERLWNEFCWKRHEASLAIPPVGEDDAGGSDVDV